MVDRPLLDVRDLRTHLIGNGGKRIVKAVDGINFTLQPGETLGIIGESGSGKSMTALTMMGLLPKAAHVMGGQILFDGENLLEKSPAEMRRIRGSRIGMIFQDPMVALDPLFTIGDQMAEPLREHLGMSSEAIRTRSVELLAQVGISSPDRRLAQYPHQMSGGMLQRVVGAIAIGCDPQLLIADEPTTALDPTVQAQFLDVLRKLKAERNLAVIIITHDFGVAARICDKIAVMYAGQFVEAGPVREVFRNPQHPYTKALLGSLPQAGKRERRARLPTIEGNPPDLSQLGPGCRFAPRCGFVLDACLTSMPEQRAISPSQAARCWLLGT